MLGEVLRGRSTNERSKRGWRTDDEDPIPAVARQIASETTLLCFDELQITDIADAMILARLFKALFDRGLSWLPRPTDHRTIYTKTV